MIEVKDHDVINMQEVVDGLLAGDTVELRPQTMLFLLAHLQTNIAFQGHAIRTIAGVASGADVSEELDRMIDLSEKSSDTLNRFFAEIKVTRGV